MVEKKGKQHTIQKQSRAYQTKRIMDPADDAPGFWWDVVFGGVEVDQTQARRVVVVAPFNAPHHVQRI